jgi:steroid delta-isomerase-like uncharacterized protein
VSTESPQKALVRSVWSAAWDRGDTDAFDTLLDAGYVRISSRGHRQSRDEFKAAVRDTRSAFPDLRTTIVDIVEEGDRMAIRWRSTATHRGHFLGLPPTEQAIEVSGATFARFAGRFVVEENVTWDPTQLVQALGVVRLG